MKYIIIASYKIKYFRQFPLPVLDFGLAHSGSEPFNYQITCFLDITVYIYNNPDVDVKLEMYLKLGLSSALANC